MHHEFDQYLLGIPRYYQKEIHLSSIHFGCYQQQQNFGLHRFQVQKVQANEDWNRQQTNYFGDVRYLHKKQCRCLQYLPAQARQNAMLLQRECSHVCHERRTILFKGRFEMSFSSIIF